MGRVVRTAAAALVATGGVLVAGPASAAENNGNGLLRLAHLSPDTPAVDVYVDAVADPDAGITLEGVGYGTVSEYQDVPPGSYTVSMREAGADPETPPVLSTTVEVGSDTARTVAGVGPFTDLGLEIIDDSLETPPEGEARVRVLAAAAGAETLDVALADGSTVAEDLAFASTGEYVDVPAGSATLEVTAGDGEPAELSVDLDAGGVYSLLVLDGDDGLTVEPVLDAASPGVVPVGGVETGAGGTADGDLPGGLVTLAVGGTAAAVALASRLRRTPAEHLAGAPRHARDR
jgi:hypothetical protein